MLLSSHASLKSTSGTGKGTRVNQLLMFLRDKDYELTTITMSEKSESKRTFGEYKTYPIGIFCRELNLFVIGKYVKSNKSGLYSLNGMDSLDFDICVKLLNMMCNYNTIGEGYVGCFSDSFAPDLMTGYNHFFYMGLEYDNFDQMMERIVSRSGKTCRGDAAWSQNGLAREFINAVRNCKRIEEINLYAEMFSYNVPVQLFGANYLDFLDLIELSDEFVEWSKHNNVLRHYTEKERNHNQFEHIYQEQQELCKELNQPTHFVNDRQPGFVIKRGKRVESMLNNIIAGERS